MVAVDLHQHFGIDTEHDGWWDRPWWWCRARVLALLDEDTRLARLAIKEARSA